MVCVFVLCACVVQRRVVASTLYAARKVSVCECVRVPVPVPLSLSLSHTHTRTLTHSHTHTHTVNTSSSWHETALLAKDLAFTACCTGKDLLACDNEPTNLCSPANVSGATTPNASGATTPNASGATSLNASASTSFDSNTSSSTGNLSRHCVTEYRPPDYCPSYSGLHEICYRLRNGSYTSTGVPVDLRPPTSSPVSFLRVSGIDAPRRATLPFSVAGVRIEYQLYSAKASSERDFFVFIRGSAGFCGAYDGVDRMGYRKIRTHPLSVNSADSSSGVMAQADIDGKYICIYFTCVCVCVCVCIVSVSVSVSLSVSACVYTHTHKHVHTHTHTQTHTLTQTHTHKHTHTHTHRMLTHTHTYTHTHTHMYIQVLLGRCIQCSSPTSPSQCATQAQDQQDPTWTRGWRWKRSMNVFSCTLTGAPYMTDAI